MQDFLGPNYFPYKCQQQSPVDIYCVQKHQTIITTERLTLSVSLDVFPGP